MPEVRAPLPANSVVMADPAGEPLRNLSFPIASGPFEPRWASIAEKHDYADVAWLHEAKFGIWVHYGAQSAGRSGDWYARRLYEQSSRYAEVYQNHLKNFGHPSEVGFKDVLRTWQPEKLDPAALIEAYKDAGARYVFLLGVHHDNFDNWDSKYQTWNSVNIGPKRDLLREWTSAARKAGMRYGITFHHEYTWWWYQRAYGADTSGPKAGVPYDAHMTLADGKGKWWEGHDPRMLYTANLTEYQGLEGDFAPQKGIFHNHREYAEWYAMWWAYRIMDAIEKYDPDFIYTDGNSTQPFTGLKSGTGMKSDAIERVVAHYYNRTLARRGKVDTFSIVKFIPPTGGVVSTKEGSIPPEIKNDQPWIGETAVGDWFYAPGFTYDAASVVRYIIENAARDGATAVCVSIMPDGSLDEGSQRMLKEIGAWMRANGEGIYGSRAWSTLGEGEIDAAKGRLRTPPGGKFGQRHAEFSYAPNDFRFTQGKDGSVYAFCVAVPTPGSTVRIRSLGLQALNTRPVRNVRVLGHSAPVKWTQEQDALALTIPESVQAQIALGLAIALG